MSASEFLTKRLKEISDCCTRADGVESDYATTDNGSPCYPSMAGALAAIVGNVAIYARSASEWTVDHLVPAEREAERLVTILEGLDIELDEESLAALEAMIKNREEYRSEIRALSGAFTKAVRETLITERELEQQDATEQLTSAGFVLNDDDGETWTKDGVTVKIELTNGRESRYKWEYENPTASDPCESLDRGVSGEFHRLLKLIAPVDSVSACGGAPPPPLAEELRNDDYCPRCGSGDPDGCNLCGRTVVEDGGTVITTTSDMLPGEFDSLATKTDTEASNG